MRKRQKTTCCDLLENSYLCGISNNNWSENLKFSEVVICLKIRTFVVSATTYGQYGGYGGGLWFAWKFVPLWYQQQLFVGKDSIKNCCDLLENSYLCGISNNHQRQGRYHEQLWFAWKFVPLWYQQQHLLRFRLIVKGCDLLENSYLCGISNNVPPREPRAWPVVICLKIRTFVVSATTGISVDSTHTGCDLLENSYLCGISNNLIPWLVSMKMGCDLLENSYLCGISNNRPYVWLSRLRLWFAWKFVPLWYQQQHWLYFYRLPSCCDLLENSYLCGISNNICCVFA